MIVLVGPADPGAYALLDHQAAKVYTSSYEMTLAAGDRGTARRPGSWRGRITPTRKDR